MTIRSIAVPKEGNTTLLNETAYFLLLGVAFLNPFPHVSFFIQAFFYASLIPVLILAMGRKKNFYYKSPLLYPLSLFFIWSAISVVFALDRADSLHDLYSHLVRYLIFYVLLINFSDTRKRLVLLTIGIILSECVFTIGTLIYYYGILNYDISSRFVLRLSSIAVDIIPFGLIMGVILSVWLIPIQKKGFQRVLLIGAMFILLFSIILTHSRGALFSLILTTPILFWKHKRIMVMMFLVIIISIVQTPMKNRIRPNLIFKDHARKALIFYSLEIIKDYPIAGTGFSIDTFRNPKYIDREKYVDRIPEEYRKNKNFFWPHNMFLHIGVRTGVFGIIIYASIFAVSLFTCVKLILYGKDEFIKNGARCCLAMVTMFLVNGLVQPVFVHFLDTIFYIILALITIVWKLNQNTPTRSA
ncbi:O-antigen ligase family protein [Desulfospira joergensenii]|uniref:O-antigen ligase family protein n=1 Tax=Desulfospira joergensenii TaxID=53329 RepID=UPI0003B72578|nr:O-antigen ligase family protein [Desulfospira joergensenii]